MLFGLGPVELAVLVVVGCLVEVVLLWAATGLADAPDSTWGKLAGVGAGVFLGGFAVACGLAYSLGVLSRPLAPDNRLSALAAAGFTFGLALVLPGLIYPAALSTSLRKGLWVSVFQWLLRAFLYVLILGVVMVVLAGVQIARGTAS